MFFVILILIDILAIVLVSYIIIRDGYNTLITNLKGFIGESIVRILIGKTDAENSYFVINNITIQVDDTTAQIDHIIICKSGIFVIETKNYKGLIYANEHDFEWIQNIYGKRYYFYSPYLQNKTHCKRISEILGSNEHIYNVIVFVRNNVDKRYCRHIYYLDEIRRIKNYPDINLSHEQCIDFYNKILYCKL